MTEHRQLLQQYVKAGLKCYNEVTEAWETLVSNDARVYFYRIIRLGKLMNFTIRILDYIIPTCSFGGTFATT